MSYAFGGADGLNAADVAVQATTAAAWAAALWLGYTQFKALSEVRRGHLRTAARAAAARRVVAALPARPAPH